MWSSQVLANAALARSYVAPLPTVAPVAPVVPAVAPLRRSATLATTGLGWNGLTSAYPYTGVSGLGLGSTWAGWNGVNGLGWNGLSSAYPYTGVSGLGWNGVNGLGVSGLGWNGVNGLGLGLGSRYGLGWNGVGLGSSLAVNNALRRSQLLGLGVPTKVVV